MALSNSSAFVVTVSGTDATAQEYIYNALGETAKITALAIVPNVSVSTHAANYITLTVKRGATTVASFTTNSSGGAAMTAGTPIAMTITGTGGDLERAAAGVWSVEVAKAGTGPAYNFSVVATLQGIRV